MKTPASYISSVVGGDATETQRKLESFRLLSTGWHYGSGGPLADAVVAKAQEMYEYLVLLGFTKTDAFPGSNGEVMVTAYHQAHYIGILVEPDLKLSLTHEQEGVDQPGLEDVNEPAVKHCLRSIADSIWSTSASSTPSTMTRLSTDSMRWRLRNPPPEVHQWSRWNVPV